MSKPNALIMRASDLLGPSYVPVAVNPLSGLTAGLDYNGNAPVDASTQINAFLAQASAKLPVILDFDIGVGMLEPVYLPNGYASIIGRGHGTGVFMMPGANCHCVSNQLGWQGSGYPNFSPNTTAPAQSMQSILIKDLFINGNRGTGAAVATPTMTTVSGSANITVSASTGIAKGQLIQGTGIPALTFVGSISGGTTVGMVDKTGAAANATASGSGVAVSFFASNSTSGTPYRPLNVGSTNTWLCGINLVSCQDVVIDNVYFYNIPSFISHIGNATNITHRNCYFDGTAVQVLHNDGIHFDGPASQLVIEGCQFDACDDNNIALNAPEGYGGDITDVAIIGCNFVKSPNALFAYTTLGGSNPQYHVKRVKLVGCNAEIFKFSDFPVTPTFVQLGGGVSGALNATDCIDQISIADCDVLGGTTTGSGVFLTFADSCGLVRVKNCTITPFQGETTINCNHSGLTVSDFDCELTLYDNTGTFGGFGLLGADASATIKRAVIDLQVGQPAGAGTSPNPYLIDPTNLTISDLEIKRLNPTYLTALINGSTWTNLPLIRGAGVIGSGFAIPDANMANGSLYMSGTTFAGDAAIKIGGTAYKVAGP